MTATSTSTSAELACVACGGCVRAAGHTRDGALVRCDRCGTRRIAIPPAHAASAPAYGAAYRAGADDRKLARLVELFVARAGRTRGSVLDVGCGDGSFLAAVRARGFTVTGVDVDPAAVANTRARAIRAVAGAAPDAELRDTFDVVTLWDVLEHVADPAATARWLADRVAAGGRVIVLTPDAGSLFDRLGRWERAATRGRSSRVDELCLNRYHLHRFSAAGLAALFAAAGVRTERIERTQVFSLRPERYLAGFAPGIAGWTGRARIDAAASRLAFAATVAAGITNKLLYVGVKALSCR